MKERGLCRFGISSWIDLNEVYDKYCNAWFEFGKNRYGIEILGSAEISIPFIDYNTKEAPSVQLLP